MWTIGIGPITAWLSDKGFLYGQQSNRVQRPRGLVGSPGCRSDTGAIGVRIRRHHGVACLRSLDRALHGGRRDSGSFPIDVLVLHTAFHRGKPKRMADICLVLNIEDMHVVSYAIKKLARLKLVSSLKQGKEKVVFTTEAGAQACQRYHEIRENLLVRSVAAMGLDQHALSRIAAQMRVLSGHYDQAARAAASL